MADMKHDWLDKDDADLTAQDLSDMLSTGRPVEVQGPCLPASATFVVAQPTTSGSVTLFGGTGVYVNAAMRLTSSGV
jgi:hypothetical protein